jgi:hypothetical protein
MWLHIKGCCHTKGDWRGAHGIFGMPMSVFLMGVEFRSSIAKYLA